MKSLRPALLFGGLLVRLAKHDSVAVLTIDHPPVNALGIGILDALSEAFEQAVKVPDIRAVVITGAGGFFSAGGEMREVEQLVAGAHEGDMEFTRTLFLRIEDSPVPVVAALNGNCFGGGLELAMACHHRVATPSIQLGLPEVKLGIIPGAGGALRLPRLAGVAKAVAMCSQGNPISAYEALECGILDRLIEDDRKGSFWAGALAFAREIAGKPFAKTRERTEKLGSPDENAPIFAAAREVARKLPGQPPAPLLAMDVVEAATRMSFEESYRFESEASARCFAGPQPKALVHVFLSEREVRNIPGIPSDLPTPPIKAAGVVGAGVMGGGIAMVFANAGIPVVLKDRSEAGVNRGLGAIRSFYLSALQKGRIKQRQFDERMALIHPTLDWKDFSQADIVVEAVFEDLALKRQVFAELDKVMKPGAILATNSSTLNIDEIAAVTARPESVIGTHFFIPPPVMRLLEIVRGRATGKETIAASMALARRLGKLGVVVGNCRGFVANRMAERYRIQASFLVEEGAPVEEVDRALMEFGMEIGPLAVGDVAGLDVIWAGRVGVRETEIAAGVRQPIEDRLFELNRYGRKTGAGWYKYGEDRRATPDPELADLIHKWAADSGIRQRCIPKDEIVERCVYMLINEGARILDEGIALRVSDIDVIYVNGYGFPRWLGGPMWYADTVGLRKICDRIEEFHREHGAVWEPAPLLRRLAESGGTFAG
jgi:3-hydroxyacyl-CoA dehydrogenase